jgi:hypothetical protein
MPGQLSPEELMTLLTLGPKGQPNAQIARALGVTEGAVRSPLRRIADGATDGRRGRPHKADPPAHVIDHWLRDGRPGLTTTTCTCTEPAEPQGLGHAPWPSTIPGRMTMSIAIAHKPAPPWAAGAVPDELARLRDDAYAALVVAHSRGLARRDPAAYQSLVDRYDAAAAAVAG